MQKEIQAPMALYPTPSTICGTVVDGRVNYLAIAHVGIVEHRTFLISVNERHELSCRGISENGTVSVSLVNLPMLEAADYCGLVSGMNTDKSGVFPCHFAEDVPNAPIIDIAPVSMVCRVIDTYRYPPFNNYILKPVHTYVQEEFLNESGKIDYEKVSPVLFEFQNAQYLSTGKVIGKAWGYGKNFKPGNV